MNTKAKNRLTMTKGLVSARLRVAGQASYGWVWVAPLADGTYRVSSVEIPRQIVDNDECFFEDDIVRIERSPVRDLASVDELVRSFGVDPNDLEAPWNNDFPL